MAGTSWRDDRRHGPKRTAGNALSAAEQAQVVSVMSLPEHAALSPKQLVPRLADQSIYLASESTMYRLRRRFGLRTRALLARTHVTRATAVHRATGDRCGVFVRCRLWRGRHLSAGQMGLRWLTGLQGIWAKEARE